MAETFQIFTASPHDASALTDIALAAKAHWGYPAHWLKEWRDQLTITANFIAANSTYIAVSHGRALGFYALLRSRSSWQLEHLWVAPESINKGIGRALFIHAADEAQKLGAARLTIEFDPHAEGFYLHLGARRVGSMASTVDGQTRELPLLEFDLINPA